jgi:hypothetical protein
MGKPSVCLAMVCRDEEKYIREALRSVKSHITCWSIMDTGSQDNTIAVIREEMAGIPGELYERPWKNWGESRTECLNLAKKSGADYLFLLDADEVVSGPMPELNDKTTYWVKIQFGSAMHYMRPNIIPAKYPWKYVGVTHEYLFSAVELKQENTELVLTTNLERATKSKERCLEDAALLEEALKKEPDNSRYVFYLAQSYKDAGEYYKALEFYHARAAMGGWNEEVWHALFTAARLMVALNYQEIDVVEAYVRAHDVNPVRAETFGELAHYLQVRQKRMLAYMFATAAKEIGPTGQKLFVDPSFAAWRNLDEYAVACYWVGNFKESLLANEKLLKSALLPESERGRIENNLKFSLRKITV